MTPVCLATSLCGVCRASRTSWICILDTNSNHGTFYYTQLASLQVLVGDNDGAKASIQEYFDGKYKEQIAANGDQVRLARL